MQTFLSTSISLPPQRAENGTWVWQWVYWWMWFHLPEIKTADSVFMIMFASSTSTTSWSVDQSHTCRDGLFITLHCLGMWNVILWFASHLWANRMWKSEDVQSELRWCHLWWFYLVSVELQLHFCWQGTCKPQYREWYAHFEIPLASRVRRTGAGGNWISHPVWLHM